MVRKEIRKKALELGLYYSGTPKYEDPPVMCEYRNECLQWATHYIEGNFYCDKHAETILTAIEGRIK